MHAVVVRASVSDPEGSRKTLNDDVIPRARTSDGFVAGYWLEPLDGKGLAVMVFENEKALVEVEGVDGRRRKAAFPQCRRHRPAGPCNAQPPQPGAPDPRRPSSKRIR